LKIDNSQWTIENALRTICERVSLLTDTPSLDAQVLLSHILEKPRAWLLAHPETSLTPAQHVELEHKLQKIETGLPLPYLLGEWEFYGLKFKVTPDTLSPRPETELLVETALAWLRQKRVGELHAVDTGTGTGCIAISLAVHHPVLHVIATDISPKALAVAEHNAQTHQVADRITFLESDLLTSPNLQSSIFDLIVANLPYIPTRTLQTLEVYGREPTLALDGGPDGLALIRRLLAQAASVLAPGGMILSEIEASQGETARQISRQHFPNARIMILPDLAGHDRLLVIKTTSPQSI
jgi:release factor glutamine methyltransferase